MSIRTATRAILNLVVGLHRSAIIREAAKADARVEARKADVKAQQQVITYEQARLATLKQDCSAAEKAALEVKIDAANELDDLPQRWPL